WHPLSPRRSKRRRESPCFTERIAGFAADAKRLRFPAGTRLAILIGIMKRWIAAPLAAGFLVACILSKGSDGAPCSKSTDCKSQGCTYGSCSGSKCKCDGGDCPSTGAASPDCEPGWECAHWSSSGDPIFHSGGGAGNSCQALCGHCPLHYKCDTPGQKFCSYD